MTANEDAIKEAMGRYLDEHFPLGEVGSPTHIPAPLEVTDAFRAGYVAARASIGPDSERIRELEAALPGPDNIVVSREALQRLYDVAQNMLPELHAYARHTGTTFTRYTEAVETVRAALSQPAQEQQT
jgi:hypothetical protein